MRKLAFLIFLGCAACTTGANSPLGGAGAGDDGGSLARIKLLVGDAACTESAQCRTLPLGERACGGPRAYLPWSTAQTPEPALRALGERYKAEQHAQIVASGEQSDCRFLADPGAECRAGTCRLRNGGADPT
jgi:hypothetical protein